MNLPVKYRPKRFEEVTGQEHVTRTLQNALKTGRIAHAYLFAGPRGVGKTTTARLLAKGLNCEHGPTPEPCNKCVMCREIDEGRSLDVVEIDGASNRGIDEIRNLREQVKFLPTRGRYRVFIIDEVHMLTTEAFNALLKTLEEPPPHVVFVLATTEPRKLPETVISRTQRFDFRPLSEVEITARLRYIAGQEKIDIEEGALQAIARHAEGSLRDAVALLEQLSVFSEGKVKAHDVFTMLGIVEDEFFLQLFDAIYRRDAVETMRLIDGLFTRGHSAKDFVKGFQNACDQLLKARLGISGNRFSEIAQRYQPQDVLAMLNASLKMEETIRYAPQPRIWIEYHLLRLVYLPRTVELSAILERAGYTVIGDRDRKPIEPAPISRSEQEALSQPSKSDEPAHSDELQQLTESVAKENLTLAHLTSAGGNIKGDTLHIKVDNDVAHELVRNGLSTIKKHANKVLKREIEVKIVRESHGKGARHSLLDHPQVKKLMEQLKLEVIDNVQANGDDERGFDASKKA